MTKAGEKLIKAMEEAQATLDGLKDPGRVHYPSRTFGLNTWLYDFVKESNKIEGIKRFWPTDFKAHDEFLSHSDILIKDLQEFVFRIQPDAILRDRVDLNVQVGNHIPPSGGPDIKDRLGDILLRANSFRDTPYQIHHEYETLHPFTDGNGRSGRALWLWMHLRSPQGKPEMVKRLGFLHTWYYESLQYGRP